MWKARFLRDYYDYFWDCAATVHIPGPATFLQHSFFYVKLEESQEKYVHLYRNKDMLKDCSEQFGELDENILTASQAADRTVILYK